MLSSDKINNQFYIKMLLLHFGYGFIIYLMPSLSKLILLGIMGSFIFVILDRKNRGNEALMAAAYIAGGEVFFRQTSAVIFYETGKYAVIIFLLIGMFFKGASSKTIPYWIYLLILFPGVIVASMTISYEADFRKLVAFNITGPVCLGVSALYCYYKKIKKEDFQRVLLMLLMPLVAQMTYLYFYTPSMNEVRISLAGNYAATGGFGPNQISTVLGLGCFLICTRLFTIRTRMINLIDLILLILMGYRAVITFSRGGVVTAILCTLAFLIFFYYKQDSDKMEGSNLRIIGVISIFTIIWIISSMETGGLIGNRYTNKNAAGELKEDITTGRVELIETELTAFYHNPIIGIGVGKGREYREEHLGVGINTHNEISRLLSEHGILGIFALAILIFVPLVFWFKFKNNFYFLAFVAFWFMTINHSAMRIALPAFVYGLALLYIVDEKKNPVHRQRLAGQ
ncbi:O-antigen ligase family protein [Christiangramia sabulilitoris]|uniref:O-antigen ligase family protein n=1 Tax=Christiangramia sabulilitoris TaxID=2583991 RepID=A0A550HYT9_9FLAO|nr:O-antigen ligase family protein [Christiangramia sabulilitoris]TRO63894.1 O-antigen ligase family protein [Christiangramia sabulilitoris]